MFLIGKVNTVKMAIHPEEEREYIRIFQNKYKKKPKHPDLTGFMIDKDGVKHDVAMWSLKTKGGAVYWAGKISNSEENRKKYKKENKQEDSSDIDELPF